MSPLYKRIQHRLHVTEYISFVSRIPIILFYSLPKKDASYSKHRHIVIPPAYEIDDARIVMGTHATYNVRQISHYILGVTITTGFTSSLFPLVHCAPV